MGIRLLEYEVFWTKPIHPDLDIKLYCCSKLHTVLVLLKSSSSLVISRKGSKGLSPENLGVFPRNHCTDMGLEVLITFL